MSEQPNEIEIVEGDLVQWVGNDGGLKTGRMLVAVHENHRVAIADHFGPCRYNQCRYSQNENAVWVRTRLIQPYPSSPISEPTK